MLISFRSLIFCFSITVLAGLVNFGFVNLGFAGDAAIEIQEGNVENWIKYYERERGIEIPAPVKKTPEADGRELNAESQGVSTESTQDNSK